MALHVVIRPKRNDALPSFSAFKQILNFLKIYDHIECNMRENVFRHILIISTMKFIISIKINCEI